MTASENYLFVESRVWGVEWDEGSMGRVEGAIGRLNGGKGLVGDGRLGLGGEVCTQVHMRGEG